MSNYFAWANTLLGGVDPYQEERDYADNARKQNRAALGMDENGNLIPPQDPNQPAQSAAAGQAAAAGVMPPGQQPNATKTDPALGHILVDLQQYQEREQGFEQALGGIGAAVSQPRNREWVKGLFNTTPPDPLKSIQAQSDLASQTQGQDRVNSLGQMLNSNDPKMMAQAQALADKLNLSLPEMRARFAADPAGFGTMIQAIGTPTDALKNLEQIQTLLQKQGVTGPDLGLLTPSLVAAVGPDFAREAIGDAYSYRTTHGGKTAPWVGPGGVDVRKYQEYSTDQKSISSSQATANESFSSNLRTTETLRQKVSDLENNRGLKQILEADAESPLKIAATNALKDPDQNWQKNAAYGIIVNDPEMLGAISELREINAGVYRTAIQSLLGHGFRPTQTEISAVNDSFGQTANLNLFSGPDAMERYKWQAVRPMLTRLDEARGEGYGSTGQASKAPKELRPFINQTFLTGGKMHLDDGAAPEDWEADQHKPLPAATRANAIAAINDPKARPGTAFAVRDGLRRQGYDVDF